MIFKASDIINKIQDITSSYIKITCFGKANMNTWGGNHIPQIFVNDLDIEEYDIYEF